MELFVQIAEKIIKQQESIIGPVAIEQASAVDGLEIDKASRKVKISGAGKQVIDNLVNRYKDLFGQVSVEVCKDAASVFIKQLPADQLPDSLK